MITSAAGFVDDWTLDLTWMGLEAPDIFALGVEDVERLTASAAGRDR